MRQSEAAMEEESDDGGQTVDVGVAAGAAAASG